MKFYVITELFSRENLPSPERRRFFPLTRDIRNHMYAATNELRMSKIDQECIRTEKKVTKRPLLFLELW